MSIDTCKFCGQWVDTDSDCGAYFLEFEDGSEIELDHCLCQNCRDEESSKATNARWYQHVTDRPVYSLKVRNSAAKMMSFIDMAYEITGNYYEGNH